MWSKISNVMSSIVQGIINCFKNLPQNMWNIGKNLVQGIWNGINNAKDWVLNKIKSFGQGIVDGIKKVFGVHSPSTVFRDEVGKNLILGLVEGIDDNSYQAIKSAKDMATEVNEAVSDNIKLSPKLGQGIKINARDFAVDTNQYVNYSDIKGQISAQSQVSINDSIAGEIRQAVIEGMRNSKITVEVEGKADKDGIFKVVQTGAREYTMQTGEPAFNY